VTSLPRPAWRLPHELLTILTTCFPV
jgi:hypothetical protein